jgi:undecaprenyl-diphosphatase
VEVAVTAGWWVVTATAVVALLLLLGALACLTRRGSMPGRSATTLPAALGVAGMLVALAAGVFALVADDEALDRTDQPVLGWLVAHRTPGWTGVAEAASLYGGTVGTGGLAVVSALVLWLRGRRGRAVVWIGAVLVGSLTIRGLKGLVERPRPPLVTRLTVETSTSLPSGHSLMAVLGLGLTVIAVLALVPGDGAHRHRRAAVRAATVLGGAVLALGIGLSRAYLGVHWTTDVLAGWLLGGALLALAVGTAAVVEGRTPEIHSSEGVPASPLR